MKSFEENARARFARQEDFCEYLFLSKGPFWHLCTPGTYQEILFVDEEDFRLGINSAALTKGPVTLYSSTVMSNHLHDIGAGRPEDLLAYFERRKAFIRRFLKDKGRVVNLDGFSCTLIPIESLKVLRNEIVYAHRNGYVIHPGHTPFSYPWSSGRYYFNPGLEADGVLYSQLSYKEKRTLCRGRGQDLPGDWIVSNGMISPQSFVDIHGGEAFFRDAHQYFTLLSKNYEAYSEVAQRLGDQVFLTDEELFSAVSALCRKNFGQTRPTILAPNDKIRVAQEMKQKYNASNGQIRRMLRLDANVVQELFPKEGGGV